jgi:hypothetical protein
MPATPLAVVAMVALVPVASAFHATPHLTRHSVLPMQQAGHTFSSQQECPLARTFAGGKSLRRLQSPALRMAEGADTTSQAEKNAQSYNIVTTLWGIAAVVNLGSLVLSPLTASMRALAVKLSPKVAESHSPPSLPCIMESENICYFSRIEILRTLSSSCPGPGCGVLPLPCDDPGTQVAGQGRAQR